MTVRTHLGTGARLASYTISSVLGRGAMGVVYDAHDARLQRRVALKVLAPSRGETERFRDRFLRESRLAASLDHPNVIPIYEAGETDGLLYIAMRLVVGTDLRGLLAGEKALGPERALRIVEQTASALDAAHAAGLLHRDVKPGNILLASDETAPEHVYLTDFGLAVSGGLEGVLDGGSFHGTAEYSAPEQIEGRPESRSDVYSLGCVLFECLTGAPPFGRRRLLETLWAHLNEEPPLLSDRLPDTPRAADAVLAAALAKSPADRPGTSGELVSAARAAFGLDGRVQSRARRFGPAAAAAVATVAAALAIVAATGVLGPTTTVEGATISTFAGTGERGSGGDGGPALEAQIADPLSIAVDRVGNVFVGEEVSHRVRRIRPDGTIDTVAGPKGLSVPIDLQVGPDGSLYILEHDRPAVHRVDARGRLTTVAGTGEAGLLADGPHTRSRDLCANPEGLALDGRGVVHIACTGAHRVIRVERDGTLTTVAGSGKGGYSGDGGPALEASLNGPQGLAFDRRGNLYIAEQFNHRVRKVDRAGVISTVAGTGRRGRSADGFKAVTADLSHPVRVAVDAAGRLYVMEWDLARLRLIDGGGFIRTVAGTGVPGFAGDGGPADEAQLGSPLGFAVDRDGDVFVADRGNHRIRKVTQGDG